MAQLTRSTGKVTWFDNIRGYGFIKPDDGGADLFVHHKSIKSDGYRTLRDNQPVEFDVQLEPDGKYQALDVTALGRGAVRSPRKDNGYSRGGRGGGFGGSWKGSNDNRRNNVYASGGGGVVCYNCDGVGHLARECTSNKRSGNYTGGGCYNCGDPEHFARDCPLPLNNGGGGGGSGSGCFKCGDYGHLARDCINRGSSGGSGRCYNCGKSGHLARDCTGGSGRRGAGGGGGGGGGGTCFNCGNPGHFARECTKVEIEYI
ncbi:cold shock protein 1-like [Pistacia vera]|uniref:cold shock protein 1-like n=1 Tax=Pistacia vera TaxID=55513 RepID=UPI001262D6F4|nr:cold shock protein 1-like [Pistacia vera]